VLTVIADATPQFFFPTSIAVDSSERIYLIEANRILVLAGVNAVDPSETVLSMDVYNSDGVPITGTSAFAIDSNGNMYCMTMLGLFVFSSVDSNHPGQLVFNTTFLTRNGSQLCTLGAGAGETHVDMEGVIYINVYCGYPGISSYYGGILVISGIYSDKPGELLSFFPIQQPGNFETFAVDSTQQIYLLTSSVANHGVSVPRTTYGVYSGFNSSIPWSQLYNGTMNNIVDFNTNSRTNVFAVSDVHGQVWLGSSSGFDLNVSLPTNSVLQSPPFVTVQLPNPFRADNPIFPLSVDVASVAISASGRIYTIVQVSTLSAIVVVRGFSNDTSTSSSSTGSSPSASSPFQWLTSQLGLTSSSGSTPETSVPSQLSSTGSGLVEVPRYLVNVLKLIIDHIASE
jgi:hypothetical protein